MTVPEVHRENKTSQDVRVVRAQVVPKVIRVYRGYVEKIQMSQDHRVSRVWVYILWVQYPPLTVKPYHQITMV